MISYVLYDERVVGNSQKIYNNMLLYCIGDDSSSIFYTYILYNVYSSDFGNVGIASGGLDPVVCGTLYTYIII